MLIKPTPDLRESEVTPRDLYLRRREFISAAGAGLTAVAAGLALPASTAAQNPSAQKLANLAKSPLSTDEKMNSYRDVTTYNNFYEFGLDKGDPARYAGSLKPRPWSIKVDGEPALRAEMVRKAGQTSVPQIWIGSTHVGGCDDLHALERAGKLDALLKG